MSAALPGTEPRPDAADLFDGDGYLRRREAWTPALAEQMAARDGIVLDERHWAILHAIRAFYDEFNTSPTTRVLLKYLARVLGPDQASSIYVMQLFPGPPAKTIARLAGLPKPTNCI